MSIQLVRLPLSLATVSGCQLRVLSGNTEETFNIGTLPQNHSFIFALLGDGIITDGDETIAIKQGELIDLTSFKGKEITYTATNKYEWIILTCLMDRQMTIEIITETPSEDYINTDHETIFVTLKGKATINDKPRTPYQSGCLLKGRTAKIKLNKNSVLAALTYKK